MLQLSEIFCMARNLNFLCVQNLKTGRQDGGELDLVHDGPPAGEGPIVRFHEEAESYPLKIRHLGEGSCINYIMG